MAKLIKNGEIIDDTWRVVREIEAMTELDGLEHEDIIVPLEFWLTNQAALKQRKSRSALWLDSHEIPTSLDNDLQCLALVALNFPVFSDGRPYSSARELRVNMSYSGEIRAIGDVLRDQLFYMARCGFDAFQMREDQDLDKALEAFSDFSEGYQSSADKPLPLFRRRA
jgi:uncharacterized protein (DUF934 family)